MTRYITLAEYLWLAEQVTGVPAPVLAKASRVDLADSALHAPMAGFGDEDFYPDLLDKAAVLVCRLCWNHPLPDGNKRAAWMSSSCSWTSTALDGIPTPRTSTAPRAAMLAVAAGEVDESWFADWLRSRVSSSS